MQELEQIEHLVMSNDIKRADILIAKLFRSHLEPDALNRLYLLRARSRLNAGRPDDSLEDLAIVQKNISVNSTLESGFLETLGDSHFARFELASVGFADRTDTVRAQFAYKKLLKLYPKYQNLGWILFQQGRILLTEMNFSEAESLFHQALVSPSHLRYLPAFCYERLGFIAYYEKRDWTQSLVFLDRALDTYPHGEDANWLVQVQILKSKVFKMLGDSENAIKSATGAIKAASSTQTEKRTLSEASLNIVELFASIAGKEKETLSYLEQFIQHTKRPPGSDVTWSRVYEIRGNAHFAQGKYDDAISDYRTSLQFNPDHPWELMIYQQIARCYYQKHSYVDTVEILSKILEIAKAEELAIEDFRIYDLLGSAFFALQRYKEAVVAYESALIIAPPNTEVTQKIQSYHDLAQELIYQ